MHRYLSLPLALSLALYRYKVNRDIIAVQKTHTHIHTKNNLQYLGDTFMMVMTPQAITLFYYDLYASAIGRVEWRQCTRSMGECSFTTLCSQQQWPVGCFGNTATQGNRCGSSVLVLVSTNDKIFFFQM